ncbi:hypothetical protein H4V99_000705 [Cryobacterium sp. CG_9.6]|nr:hypothetical protein [Cryobacterium sp. CG_9.6]
MKPRVSLPPELVDRSFLVADGQLAGIGRSRLNGRDLASPFWGVRSAGAFDGSTHAYCRALLQRMPPTAFFSHETAALLLGFPLPVRCLSVLPLHVGVHAPARALTAHNVTGHSLKIGTGDLIHHGDLRFTSPVRTWLDLAAQLSVVELVTVGDFLIGGTHPLLSMDDLTQGVGECSQRRRGLSSARLALPYLRAGSESPKESELRMIIVLAGLPEPVCNFEIFDNAGRFLARADLAYPEFKVLLEYQGDHHRTDRSQWRRDITRLGRVEDEGWQALQFTDDDLKAPVPLTVRLAKRLTNRGWVVPPQTPDAAQH